MTARFKDQSGQTVQFQDCVPNRPVILLPIFYRCEGVCNLELQGLLKALPLVTSKQIGRDFDMIVLSINPTEGTDLARTKFESTLRAAPALVGTESGWHFLTGSSDQIRSVTDAVGFHYTYDAAKNLVNHPSGLMFLTPNGVVSGYILGIDYNPKTIEASIDLAYKSEVGSRAPDVFFGCIHVDPITGQRSLVVEKAVQFACYATVLTIALSISVHSVRRKQRLRRAMAEEQGF